MNADKTFVDTNVLIYAFSADEPEKQRKALQALESIRPVISKQVLKEFVNVLVKKGSASYDKLKDTIKDILEITDLVDESVMMILHSLDIQERYRFSFYDSLIIAAALASDCHTLLSEDMQGGQLIEGRLEIVNPFV